MDNHKSYQKTRPSNILDRLCSNETIFGAILAVVVGVIAGFGAVIFRWLISTLQSLLFGGGASILSFLGQNYIILLPVVGGLIVGLPRSMGGSIGKQVEKVKAFTRKLCEHTEVPVQFRDERLTTVSAKRLMQAVNTKKTREKARHDAIAAALILQGYLDERH